MNGARLYPNEAKQAPGSAASRWKRSTRVPRQKDLVGAWVQQHGPISEALHGESQRDEAHCPSSPQRGSLKSARGNALGGPNDMVFEP